MARWVDYFTGKTIQFSNLGSLIILTLQIIEWIVMIYVIKTQMNRSIGEITFDHQQERITEAIERNDKNKFRRNERKMQKVLYCYGFVFIPLMYLVYPTIYLNLLKQY